MSTPPDDDLTCLDAAFELPDVVTDTKLRNLYEVLVARLREEARHLPMNTVQQLLIERIAYNYIVLRSKERGELGGFAHSGVQKDYNTFWLDMTREFNKMLGKGEPMTSAERKSLLKEIQRIISATVAELPDPAVRQSVMTKFVAAFEKAKI